MSVAGSSRDVCLASIGVSFFYHPLFVSRALSLPFSVQAFVVM